MITDATRALQAKAIQLAKLAIQATTSAGSGHPSTALSLAHIVTVLMYRVMRWDPANPRAAGSDRLVLSEGHAVPIVYAACADLGVTITPGGIARPMTMDDLMALRRIDSPIDGHPNPALGFPFFDAATGSLGQGLSVAAGLAAAAQVNGLNKTIFCIIGDGETREGQIWEAMDFIADHGLTNVVALINCNMLGQSDYVSNAQDWQALQRKAEAFAWETAVVDGHDPVAIEAALRNLPRVGTGKPLCILARTIKGWGVPSLAGPGHHGTPIAKDHLAAALDDLDKKAKELGVIEILHANARYTFEIAPPPAASIQKPRRVPPSFHGAIETEPKTAKELAEKGVMSPRRAFGLALKSLGASNKSVLALDADVKNSTYAADFAEAYPKRYFEARIAEQNMVSVAAGMSAGGMLPFASTFGRFLERAFDQIEMAIVSGANIKLVGTHVGVTLASDGPSQMALADISFMRAFAHSTDHRGNPAITVLTPSDAVSAYALAIAMADFPSSCYLRAARADLPLVYKANTEFPLGGHKVLRSATGSNGSVVLVACGYMVHSCLKAAQELAKGGIEVGVVDAYSLPMNAAPILAMAGTAGTILSVEDSYVGGVGSELAEAAAALHEAPRVLSLTVHKLPKSGRSADDVLGYVSLSIADIVGAAKAASQQAR